MANSGVHIAITDQAINMATLLEGLASSEHGGECCFTGRVRAHNVGREVRGVAYDIHETLAVRSLAEIVYAARERWEPDAHVTLVHRQGYLNVGEISVVIAVSCRHRAEAFSMNRQIIEELKHRTPIWKKEYYVDGESSWVQGHALCQKK